MNPNEEQKKAAQIGLHYGSCLKHQSLYAACDCDAAGDIASLLASREQQAAENAARAIVEAVKNREPIAAYGLIEGDKRKAEVFLRLQHSQWEGDVANAASAAAPFLNPKGE